MQGARQLFATCALLALLSGGLATADIVFDDGGTHNVSMALSENVLIREGTTVNLLAGAMIMPPASHVRVERGLLNIEGGEILDVRLAISGAYASATLYSGSVSTVDVSAGSVFVCLGGSADFIEVEDYNSSDGTAYAAIGGGTVASATGGFVEVYGGRVGDLSVTNGWISGGVVDYLVPGRDFTKITGGTVNSIYAVGSALVDVHGGTVNHIETERPARVELHGTNFNYPFGPVGDMSGTLTGTLENGDAIAASFVRWDPESSIILIEYVPEPATLVILAPGALAIIRRYRR